MDGFSAGVEVLERRSVYACASSALSPPSSAPVLCPAPLSAAEALDADCGDSVTPSKGQMTAAPAASPAEVSDASVGAAVRRRRSTGPSPFFRAAPSLLEATLQVLLARFAALSEWMAAHGRLLPPSPELFPPLHDR